MTSNNRNESTGQPASGEVRFNQDGADIPPMQYMAVPKSKETFPKKPAISSKNGAHIPPMQPVAKLPTPPAKPSSNPKGEQPSKK